VIKPKKTVKVQNQSQISLNQLHQTNQLNAANQIYNTAVTKKSPKVTTPPPLTQTVVPKKTMAVPHVTKQNKSPPMPKLVQNPKIAKSIQNGPKVTTKNNGPKTNKIRSEPATKPPSNQL